MPTELVRCEWPRNPLAIEYHDREWGTPVHNDRILFEFLILEGAQAGLSWDTILARREGYRAALSQFDPQAIARYNARKVESLMKDARIIRNRLKIESAVKNAKAFLKVQESFGSFDRYLWDFVGGKPIVNRWKSLAEIPPHTHYSDTLSKDLGKRGFKFVGTTIIYAFMQAVGMVDDHIVTCFRKTQLAAARASSA